MSQRHNVAIGTLKNFFSKKTSQKNVSESDSNVTDDTSSKSLILSSPTNFSKKTDNNTIIDTTRNFSIEDDKDEYDDNYNESESTMNVDNGEYDSANENDSEKSNMSSSTTTSVSSRRKRKSTDKKKLSKRKESTINEISSSSIVNTAEDDEEFQYEQAETVVVDNPEFEDEHASEQSLSTSSRRRKHRKHRSSIKLSTEKPEIEEEKLAENRKNLTFLPPPLPSPPVKPPTLEERKKSITNLSISSIEKNEPIDIQEKPITPRTPRTPRKSSQNTVVELNNSSEKVDYFGAVESALERSRSGNNLLRRSSSRRSSLAVSNTSPAVTDTSTTIIALNNTAISEEKDNINSSNKVLPKLELKNVEQVRSVMPFHHKFY